MMARRAQPIRPWLHAKTGFGRQQDLVTSPFDCLAQDLFGQPLGVNIRCVEKVDTRLQGNVNQAGSLIDLCTAPHFKEIGATTKGGRAKGQNRDFEAGVAELSVFHVDCSLYVLARYVG